MTTMEYLSLEQPTSPGLLTQPSGEGQVLFTCSGLIVGQKDGDTDDDSQEQKKKREEKREGGGRVVGTDCYK